MPVRLVFTDSDIRRARKFLRRHTQILGQYEKTLQLLEMNYRHPSLQLHNLEGALSNVRIDQNTMTQYANFILLLMRSNNYEHAPENHHPD
jgi:hypothetical protein